MTSYTQIMMVEREEGLDNKKIDPHYILVGPTNYGWTHGCPQAVMHAHVTKLPPMKCELKGY